MTIVIQPPAIHNQYPFGQAWVDLDHDGIEDILLEMANYACSGTMCFHRYVILTRKQRDGRVVVVKELY